MAGGRGVPEDVDAMLAAVLGEVPAQRLAGHFHDTSGRALENIEVALARGLRVFDAAVGGLGGCPYAPGAAGNVATEAVAERLEHLGYVTGLDRDVIAEAAAMARDMQTTAHERCLQITRTPHGHGRPGLAPPCEPLVGMVTFDGAAAAGSCDLEPGLDRMVGSARGRPCPRVDMVEPARIPGVGNKNYYHLILLAENYTGYKNLIKLASAGYLDGFYYRPRIDKELLQQHNEGLIPVVGGEGDRRWQIVGWIVEESTRHRV